MLNLRKYFLSLIKKINWPISVQLLNKLTIMYILFIVTTSVRFFISEGANIQSGRNQVGSAPESSQ